MSEYRRATRPLNPEAVKAANAAMSKETGSRQLTMGPEDAALRTKWMDEYIAAGGKCEVVKPSSKKPNGTTISCPPKTALTEEEAGNLFSELKNQPQITFDYPMDCCYTRAHEMCRIMESKGVECRKYWLFDRNWGESGMMRSSLAPMRGGKAVEFPDPDTGKREPVRWVYHVAPIVKVKKADGSVGEMVMDPSIASGPVTKEEWRRIQGNPPGAYDEYSDSKAYFKNDKKGYREEDPNGEKTKKKLEDHKKSRDKALKREKELKKTS